MKLNDVKRVIGARIRAARLHRAMTQQELATRARLSRTQVTNLEYGRSNPTLWTLLKIAEAVGYEPHVFFLSVGQFPFDTRFIRNEHPIAVSTLIQPGRAAIAPEPDAEGGEDGNVD